MSRSGHAACRKNSEARAFAQSEEDEMDEHSTRNVIRLDDYRRLPPASHAAGTEVAHTEGDPVDLEDFDLCDAYGRTIADWIWAELFENASGADDADEADTPHCEVIYWQFAASAGRR